MLNVLNEHIDLINIAHQHLTLCFFVVAMIAPIEKFCKNITAKYICYILLATFAASGLYLSITTLPESIYHLPKQITYAAAGTALIIFFFLGRFIKKLHSR